MLSYTSGSSVDVCVCVDPGYLCVWLCQVSLDQKTQQVGWQPGGVTQVGAKLRLYLKL